MTRRVVHNKREIRQMISPQDIPLAAMEDMLESVLPIIFIVLYGLSQLMGGKKNKPQRGKDPRPRQVAQPGNQPPAGAHPQAGGGPVGMEEVLRKEVDEFLRRAQGKPPRPEPPKPEPKPREVGAGRLEAAPRRLKPAQERPALGRLEQSRPEKGRLEKGRRLVQQRPAKQAGRPTARPTVKVRGTGVSEHVAEHISSSSREISQHAENLGEVLAQTDERLEDRLSKKFDRDIGQLKHQEVDKVEARVDIAAEIAEMLSKPSGMRQLIIANEILRRSFE